MTMGKGIGKCRQARRPPPPLPPGVSFHDFIASFAYTGSTGREADQKAPPPPPRPPAAKTRRRNEPMIIKLKDSGEIRVVSPFFPLPEGAVLVKKADRKRKKPGPEKKKRAPSPQLSAAERRSDKYLRVPEGCLVPPPPSPHQLLQERYASDPWKVIIICVLLNATSGGQVRKIVHDLFSLCPNAETAANTPDTAIENIIETGGLQRTRAIKIKLLSEQYLGGTWTHITELDGVGKYAADAYAIFCAGKAREVLPRDHKLVDYWKFVCGVTDAEYNAAIQKEDEHKAAMKQKKKDDAAMKQKKKGDTAVKREAEGNVTMKQETIGTAVAEASPEMAW